LISKGPSEFDPKTIEETVAEEELETEEELEESEEENSEEEAVEGSDGEESEENEEESAESDSTETTSIIAQMSETIGELKAELAAIKKPKKEEKPSEVEPFKPLEFDAAKNFDPDDTEKHEEFFNKFGNDIAQKTIEHTVRTLVPTIQRAVTETVTTQSAVNEFWNANADLLQGKTPEQSEAIRQKVGKLANTLRAADPGKSVYEVLAETTTIIRGGKPAPTKEVKKKKVAKSPKPRSTNRSTKTKEKAGISDEIDDLFN
jgi:hypothetical protein